jgi:hypothetical protein
MKVTTNTLFQSLATIVQMANQYSGAVPDKYKMLVAGGVGILQGIISIWSHFRNPDGTPAVLPYQPK